MIGDARSSCLKMTLNAVLIGGDPFGLELGHGRRWLYTKQPQEGRTEDIKRSITCTTTVLFSRRYIMATYFIPVHTLLQRLHAEQAVDEEHGCQFDACLEHVDLDVQRTTRLKMIERKVLYVRSTSCPAATTTSRGSRRVDR